MISAEEAHDISENAVPGRERAEADSLAQNALNWALHNAEGRTNTRIQMYAKYGNRSLSVKFAPGVTDSNGNGNSFYNDLVGNSNVKVADAICSVIYGREQDLLSPIMTARIINTYSARLAKFVNDLRRLGYDIETGNDEPGNTNLDDSTIIINW